MTACIEQVAIHERHGVGPPIVCVHGNSADASSFVPLSNVAPFAARHFVAMDLPGHGDSPRAARYGLSLHADHLAAVLARHPGALVLGHSLGGHVILHALARGLITSAAGIAIFGTPPMPSLSAVEHAFSSPETLRFAFSGALDETSARAWAQAAWAPAKPPESFVLQLRATDPNARLSLSASLADDFRDEVQAILHAPCPVAIFHAANDAVVSRRYIESLALRAIWRHAPVIIPGVGHYGHATHPAPYAAAIAAFESRACRCVSERN